MLSANWNDFLRTNQEISETFGDVHLHLSIFEARDVNVHGSRHSAGWCDGAYKSRETTKKGERESVRSNLHKQTKGERSKKR